MIRGNLERARLTKTSSNWKTFDERTFDFCQGITLHHLPGHTDGLIGMQINMPVMGTYFFISDHCHVIENVSTRGITHYSEPKLTLFI